MPRLSGDYGATKKVVSPNRLAATTKKVVYPNRLPAPSEGKRFMVGMGIGLVYCIGFNYAAGVWYDWTRANKGPQRGRGRMP